MGPFSHSFCACIIIPSRTIHYSSVCPALYVLCILLNVSISGKEERKAGRKEWGQREGKRKEGHKGGKEEKRGRKDKIRGREKGKEGRREGGLKRGRLGEQGEQNLVIGIISAQTYFYLLETEPESQPSCLLYPGHISAVPLCFRYLVMLLGSDQGEPV